LIDNSTNFYLISSLFLNVILLRFNTIHILIITLIFAIVENLKKFKSLFALCLFLVFLQGCQLENAKKLSHQYVNVYSDLNCHQDSLVYSLFEKQEKIKVYPHYLPTDSLVKLIEKNQFACGIDVILLSNVAKMKTFHLKEHFVNLENEKFEIDVNYKNKTWIATSKSPLIFVYNKMYLQQNLPRYYADLSNPTWKGKLTLTSSGNASWDVFEKSYRKIKLSEIDSFFVKLKQNSKNHLGTDFEALHKVRKGESQLTMVELSSFLEFKNLKKDSSFASTVRNLEVIFPSQHKKGVIYNVHTASIYRYAENYTNAEKLIQFILTKSNQYNWTVKRNTFPVNSASFVPDSLQRYENHRGRFFKDAF
jgi:ABC-type Fe3+ transport system substrate-binding protein